MVGRISTIPSSIKERRVLNIKITKISVIFCIIVRDNFGLDAEWHFFATSHGNNALAMQSTL